MERPSLSTAIFLVVLILAVLALALPSNTTNIDQDQAEAAAAGAAAKQRGPDEPIIVTLVGHGSDTISLAFQPHDLSLAGFANGSHHWFVFPGNEHVITNDTTTLPFGNSYRDLVGGLANLPSLPLGRDPVLRAITAISACDDPATTADEDDDDDAKAKLVALKRGLATVMVTKCEAMRLAPVADAVSGGWESGDGRLTEQHLRYIEHWDTMSFELVRARRTGRWDGPFTELLRKSADIHSEDDALAVVSLIANPTMAQLLKAHARSA